VAPKGRLGRSSRRSVPQPWNGGEQSHNLRVAHLSTVTVTDSPMRTNPLLLLVALMLVAHEASAQSAADSAAIRATALDYIDGWYAADGARMERALHSELAKRNVTTDPTNGRSQLRQMSAMTLVQGTRSGGGSNIPVEKRRNEVKILDVYQGAASVRVQAATWIDYMHMSKVNGRWVIMNVLWENEPSIKP
jgi:hypothetical protein